MWKYTRKYFRSLFTWTAVFATVLLLACAKSHMMSASRRQPHLLHVSAVDRRQIWSMYKSWRCVTLSGFLHSHIVRCWWNPISCGTHYSGPGLSENDSAVTTDVCEDQNREVGLWGLPLKWNWPPVADCQSSLHRLVTSIDCKSLHSGLRNSRGSGGGWKTASYNGQSRWHSACVIRLSKHPINKKLSYCKQITHQHLWHKKFWILGPWPLGIVASPCHPSPTWNSPLPHMLSHHIWSL